MKVVVAIDGRQCAQTALEYILNKKYAVDTKFYLVHVMVPGFADAPVEGIPDVVAQEKKEEQTLLVEMTSTIKDKLGAMVTSNIISGEAAPLIAQACKQFDADEAIIPSHARHGFSRLWFGSVADDIVDMAPCTVVVLKMPINSNQTMA